MLDFLLLAEAEFPVDCALVLGLLLELCQFNLKLLNRQVVSINLLLCIGHFRLPSLEKVLHLLLLLYFVLVGQARLLSLLSLQHFLNQRVQVLYFLP